MVVAVEPGGCDLHACANCNSRPASLVFRVELEPAGHDARGHEVLRFSVVLAAEEVSRVGSDLGPQIFTQMVLPKDGYRTQSLDGCLGAFIKPAYNVVNPTQSQRPFGGSL